jgi:hypothetical protein
LQAFKATAWNWHSINCRNVAQAVAGGEEEIDPLQYRPNPEALVSRLDGGQQASQDGGGLLYRAPKLNPVAMEEDPDKDQHKRERRAATNLARKSGRNQLVRDLAREVAEAPDEVRPEPPLVFSERR